MDSQLIPLQEATRRELVGSKAAALAELAAAGLRVPDGVVVTAGDRLDEAAIAGAVARLGATRLAVRSSGSAEDLPGASYAGLYETILNVEPTDVPDAVRACFASAGGDRVRSYHERQDAGDSSPAMAVLIQPMVNADCAGVAFTANPLTGAEETVLTAVSGLGERLVSGEAVAEEWIARRGVVEATRRGESPVLSEAEARSVAELADRVAQRYGCAQDIEWAIAAGELYLLQARPMTALPQPAAFAAPGPGLWMRNFRLGEWLPEPMTPLFAEWLLPVLENGYLAGMRGTVGTVVPFPYAVVNGWYYNTTPHPTPRLLARALGQTRGRILRILFHALFLVGRNPARADRAVLSAVHRKWRTVHLPAYRRLVADATRGIDTADDRQLAETVARVGAAAGAQLWFLAILGGSAWKMEACLARFCRDKLPDIFQDELDGSVQVLLSGLRGPEPTPPHAVQSLDWYWPTAGELESAGPEPIAGRREELVARRQHAEAACRRALGERPRLRARFDALLAVAQKYAVIREDQARELTLGWPLLRQCIRRIGRQLPAAAGLADPDDVFFLTRTDLEGGPIDAGELSERKARWAAQRRLPAPLTLGRPPRLGGDVIAATVQRARGAQEVPDGAIVGEPASAGRATGRVRLISGVEDFDRFLDGEILVARATAPAWTPLFARAAGIVTNGGTLAAHASLVAREFGIPAVVGTGDATTRLRDGDLVTVDGTRGLVCPALAPDASRGRS